MAQVTIKIIHLQMYRKKEYGKDGYHNRQNYLIHEAKKMKKKIMAKTINSEQVPANVEAYI